MNKLILSNFSRQHSTLNKLEQRYHTMANTLFNADETYALSPSLITASVKSSWLLRTEEASKLNESLLIYLDRLPEEEAKKIGNNKALYHTLHQNCYESPLEKTSPTFLCQIRGNIYSPAQRVQIASEDTQLNFPDIDFDEAKAEVRDRLNNQVVREVLFATYQQYSPDLVTEHDPDDFIQPFLRKGRAFTSSFNFLPRTSREVLATIVSQNPSKLKQMANLVTAKNNENQILYGLIITDIAQRRMGQFVAKEKAAQDLHASTIENVTTAAQPPASKSRKVKTSDIEVQEVETIVLPQVIPPVAKPASPLISKSQLVSNIEWALHDKKAQMPDRLNVMANMCHLIEANDCYQTPGVLKTLGNALVETTETTEAIDPDMRESMVHAFIVAATRHPEFIPYSFASNKTKILEMRFSPDRKIILQEKSSPLQSRLQLL